MNVANQAVILDYFIDAAVAIFIITPDHNVIFWNKACEGLTGFSSGAMLNTKNHWQPFYKEYRPCLVDIVLDGNYSVLPELYGTYGKAKLAPEGICAEGWYENLGGKKRYIVFEAVPVFNSSGEIVAAVETLQDFTESKQTESEKLNIFSELNQTLSEKESLKGFIPICSSCKDIRNKDGMWIPLESYFMRQSALLFSHGICPNCVKKLYPDIYDEIRE